MRPKLIKSFTVVATFWFVATTLYWSVQQPEVNLRALAAIAALLPFLPIEVPTEVGIFGSWKVQLQVLSYWSIPVGVLAVISALIGYGVMWVFAFKKRNQRDHREQGKGNFRGVTLTVGELPVPDRLPRDEIDIGAEDNEMLARMTERERRLLCDILGTISAHSNAYPGPGISSSLLEHTLNLVSKALTHPRHPALSALVASASELGKITSFVNDGGEWKLKKNLDKESARILASLDSWFALPHLEKNAVLMAVKHKANPRLIPDIDGDPQIYRLARELLNVADEAQTKAETEEKQKTLEQTSELPDVILEAFLKALPALSFQSRGLPKGVAAVAWKVGRRVFMLEIKLRETVMAKLPPDVRGALTPSGKERQRLQPFTRELLKSLAAQKWLVLAIDDMTVEEQEALWNIKAGKLDFKGVIVIDVPDEFIKQLPTDDSMYPITVTGPLFVPQNNASSAARQTGNLSREDLLGSVLRPGNSA